MKHVPLFQHNNSEIADCPKTPFSSVLEISQKFAVTPFKT